jgi:NADPH:quinone reductase-like Zn-dependent oxidoreductase
LHHHRDVGGPGGGVGQARQFACRCDSQVFRFNRTIASFFPAGTTAGLPSPAWLARSAAARQAGDTVLVQGTGGVALFGLQLATAQGARVIVTSSSDDKLARARQLGAWKTINYRSQPAWDQAALDYTEGRGVDHILELGGPDTYDKSISAIAAGGHIAQIGVLTGFAPQPNILPLQFKNANINGICVGSVAHHQRLSQFMATHQIHPVIDQQFGFDEAELAYQQLQAAGHFGKLVIRLN